MPKKKTYPDTVRPLLDLHCIAICNVIGRDRMNMNASKFIRYLVEKEYAAWTGGDKDKYHKRLTSDEQGYIEQYPRKAMDKKRKKAGENTITKPD